MQYLVMMAFFRGREGCQLNHESNEVGQWHGMKVET